MPGTANASLADPLHQRSHLAPFLAIGDPLADAAIAEVATLGADAAALLDHGVRHGPMPDMPPAIAALLQATALPEWADAERLRRGSDAYLAIGSSWIGLALGPGSLTHTYSAASIATVLVRTGNLVRMARRRLIETGAWNVVTVLPDGLQPGHDGHIHNLQVRLLHARVRHALCKQGWARSQGMPINQIELARTWLDFTYVPFRALGTLGITFTADEIADLYHLWQVAAHLLGVDPRLYRAVTDQASGAALLAAIDAMLPPAGEESRALTAAMLEAMGELLAPQLHMSIPMARALAASVLRRLHGPALADQLGVARNWTAALLPPLVAANRWRRWRERRDPARRRAAIDATVQAFSQGEGLLSEGTTYQRAARDAAADRLPVAQPA